MKKLFALLLAALMVITAVACGSAEPAESKGEEKTSEAATEGDTSAAPATNKNLPTVEGDVEILFWDIATEDPNKTQHEDAVARFTADYPNVKVTEVHTQNDNYKQQLVISMSSGSCPNMYIHWGGGPMAEYYKSGFVNDLTDLYNTYDHADYIEAAMAQSTYDGKILAIPFGGLSGCDLFFNKTILDELGISYPIEYLDELEEACAKVKEAGYTPFALANKSKWTGSMYYMYMVARHSGNEQFDAAYEQTGSFTSEAFIFASDKIQDWVQKGYFPDGVNSLSPDDGQDKQLLYDGSAVFMLHGSWMASGMNTDNAEWYSQNIGVMAWPKDREAEAAGVDQKVEVGTAIGNGFSMNCFNADGSVNENQLNACYILATNYFSDQTWIDEKLSTGTIPSIEGCADGIEDPNMKIVSDIFFSATNVQLWYDQYLPASVTEVHKNCMTELFGLTNDGKGIGEEQDAAMQAEINK